MRILVNYNKAEQSHIPILQYHLRARNLQAIATNMTLTPGELVAKAQQSNCLQVIKIRQNPNYQSWQEIHYPKEMCFGIS